MYIPYIFIYQLILKWADPWILKQNTVKNADKPTLEFLYVLIFTNLAYLQVHILNSTIVYTCK